MQDSTIFATNPIIKVASTAISQSPVVRKSKCKKVKVTNQFLYEFTEKHLRKALSQVTRVPVTVALILGMSIVTQDKMTGQISCSLWSLHTLLAVLRVPVMIALFYNYFHNREMYMKMFGGWGATEEFSHGLSIISALICDVICILLTYKNVKSAEAEHNKLLKFIVDVTVGTNEFPGVASSTSEAGPCEYLKRLKKGQRVTEGLVSLILFFFVVAYISSLRNAFVHALAVPESRDNIPLLVMLPLLMLYFIGVQILRQVAYYGWIGTMMLLCFGILALKDLIHREIKRSKQLPLREVEKIVTKIFDHFRTIYELVDEMNVKHQGVLVTGVVSLLVIIICSSFQFCVGLRNPNFYTLVGASSIVLSNCLTFFCICSISSFLTGQAKRCMNAIRDFVIEDSQVEKSEIQMSKALKQKIRMWHMEGTMQPPQISPGYFFTLRRNAIPPIVAMLITYLLVLVQFQLKDKLDYKIRSGNITETGSNFTLSL